MTFSERKVMHFANGLDSRCYQGTPRTGLKIINCLGECSLVH